MSNHGKIWWTELNTWDADKARAYYAAVLGWTFETMPTAGTDADRPYYVAHKDGVPVAGIFTMISPAFDGISDHWFTYIAVDDLEVALAASTDAGGQVCRPPFLIPGFGRLAIVADANKAFMGFLEPQEEIEHVNQS